MKNDDFRVTLTRFFLVLCTALALTVTLSAQVQNGQFQGTVLDQSGAAVPNAKVTATNEGTGQKITANTNNSGFYSIPQLPVGQYKLAVEATGFKSVTAANQTVNAGVIQRLDFKLPVGQRTETVEVTDIATAVNTEDFKLANTVGATQIANLPLNGRNIYDLIQIAPGAVNVRGVLSENGANTVVNGVRENFNGFLLNGVSNKGLSGGAVNQPIQDSVQEFQLVTLNMSAQYGNSAGSITNLVTKSGTNNFHGNLWEFVRNDKFDATNFFLNHTGEKKTPLRFNQFGGTFGGPIFKDKLFFFGAYQGDRFITSLTPSPTTVESPEWRQAVAAGLPNSVAGLLYSSFPPSVQGTVSDCGGPCTLDAYLTSQLTGAFFEDPVNGATTYSSAADWLCDAHIVGLGGSSAQAATIVQRIAAVIGVTAVDQSALASMGCTVLPLQAGTMSRSAPMLFDTVNIAKSRTQGNLFNGNEASLRIDFNPSDRDRFFTQFNWQRQNDEFLGGSSALRNFFNPQKVTFPNFQISYVRSFTPTFLNEFKAGYAGNINLINTALPGVPSIGLDDGTMGFGSYNGYPQFFKENIYSYSDMVSVAKGKHNMKIGADIRRNIENSEFNVGRPSYYFRDPLFFAADSPYSMAAGVDPGFATGQPAHLQSNIRHWRNWEYGFFFNDDFKMSRRLTLSLGLRYDLYQRHTEENNLATTFLKGPGNLVIDNITTGAGFLKDANIPIGAPGCDTPQQMAQAVLAGVCGPGGFAPAKRLGKGDFNNFGPRVGFAWDVFGDAKTSLRGGAGVSYEGTLYNPLSNSRWNPPYYSFNGVSNFLDEDISVVPYGPQSGGAPSFTGPPDPLNFQGSGSTAVGNIMGWNPNNPNQAILTGIIFPEGIRDPYVINWYLGLQHELVPKTVFELDYVSTQGRKLFRAENINRISGGTLDEGTCTVDIFGRQLCSQFSDFNPLGRLNPNYGRLRVWQNVVNSNYHALQASVRRALSHGLQLQVNYTFGHAIDNGSTWHSGATSANLNAAGEGFTTDQTLPGLDRGNSIFDVRHVLVVNYVWELPFLKNAGGVLGTVLGGWQLNGIVSFHTGAHWSAFCAPSRAQCDFNRDREVNDRPNSTITSFDASHDQWANGWGLPDFNTPGSPFSKPPAGSPGNLGRNTFVGARFIEWNPSIFKNFKVTERVNLQFRTEFFNALNHANFQLPGTNAPSSSASHGMVRNATFGQAGGTFNPRQLQFGLKLNF